MKHVNQSRALLLSVGAAVSILAASGGVTTAHAASANPEDLVRSVLTAPNAVAAYHRLSPAEQDAFQTAFAEHQTPTVVFSITTPAGAPVAADGSQPSTDADPLGPPASTPTDDASQSATQTSGLVGATDPTAAQRAALAAAPAATASGCWQQYKYVEWYDFGIHDGNTWMQLNWCASGGTVTSHTVTNVGGQGLGGVSYAGVIGTGATSVGWEVRSFREFKFTLGGAAANPCMQLRGGATGLYSYRSTCNRS